MIYRKLLDAYSEKQRLLKTIDFQNGKDNLELLQRIRNFKGKKFKNNTVIIGGAGLAGLCCAYELRNLGFNIVLLEAQSEHIGGRARTYRVSKEVYGEFGAMRIPEKHLLTRHYIKEFNLVLRKFIQANPNAYSFIRGEKNRIGEIEKMKLKFNLKDNEKDKTTLDYWLSTIGKIIDVLNKEQQKQIFEENISDPFLRSLDKKSLYELLSDSELSNDAIELLVSSWSLETSLQISLFEFLREEIEGIWVGDFDEIVGGTDLLAKSFQNILAPFIRQDAEVISVEQNSFEVNVKYINDKKEKEVVKGDWFICTFPLGVVQKIKFVPELSYTKRTAIRRVSYDSATKILAKSNIRFWELNDGIYGGGSISDQVFGSTWYPSDNIDKNHNLSNSPSVFLASYTWGQFSRRLDKIPVNRLKELVIENLGKIHSSLCIDNNYIQEVIRWSWTDFEWSSGAYAFFMPNEHSDLYKHLVKPEGKVLLAGEHASVTHSWMQGSFESALGVIEYIIAQSLVSK
jgi:monoamine oxidase